MIRSMLASKTAKMVAACVCPVAGTTAVTVSVPQVRQAVHSATAPKTPRAYAAPKTRVRPAALAPCPEPVPVVISSVAAPSVQPVSETRPVELATNDLTPRLTPATPTNRPIRTVPVRITPGVVGAVPEAGTWVQMIVGFGLVGGAVRAGAARGDSRLA